MNLLTDNWIPVRTLDGTGPFRQISFEELLCGNGIWQVSLPRDDFELACQQLLICLTQILFLPHSKQELHDRVGRLMTAAEYSDAIKPVLDWFDLDHPKTPFMQVRGIKAAGMTPIQKLLTGMPEGNNHAFFNEVGEVRSLGGACAAIALFNQATNAPNFSGKYKGGLRGGSPVTTLVAGDHLRQTVWKNVLTLEHIQDFLPRYELSYDRDRPTWVAPIKKKETIYSKDIGLIRGLFWQPVLLELVGSSNISCDLLGTQSQSTYSGFNAEPFTYQVEGLWPHPHGARTASFKQGQVQWKYVSFTSTAPAWTQLTEFVVPGPWNEETKEGTIPAASVLQAQNDGALHLLVGGYRNKQASVLERRHELLSLAAGWADEKGGRIKQLVDLGKKSRAALYGQLYYASKGNKARDMKGIGVEIHKIGGTLFYSKTEALLHEALEQDMTFKEFKTARERLAHKLSVICKSIFEQLTDPYAMKPEFIPIIAAARRSLEMEMNNLIEGVHQHGEKQRKRKAAKP